MPYQSVVVGVLDVVVSHHGLEVVVLGVVVSHRFVVVVSHRFVVVVSYQVEVAVVHQGVVRGVVWVFSISRWQSGAFTSFGTFSLGKGYHEK